MATCTPLTFLLFILCSDAVRAVALFSIYSVLQFFFSLHLIFSYFGISEVEANCGPWREQRLLTVFLVSNVRHQEESNRAL